MSWAPLSLGLGLGLGLGLALGLGPRLGRGLGSLSLSALGVFLRVGRTACNFGASFGSMSLATVCFRVFCTALTVWRKRARAEGFPEDVVVSAIVAAGATALSPSKDARVSG